MAIKVLCILQNKDFTYEMENKFSSQIINNTLQLFFFQNINNINIKMYDILIVDNEIKNITNNKIPIIFITKTSLKDVNYVLMPIDYKILYEKILNIYYNPHKTTDNVIPKAYIPSQERNHEYIVNIDNDLQETVVTTFTLNEKEKLNEILEEYNTHQHLNRTIITQAKIIFEEMFHFLENTHILSNKKEKIATTFIKKSNSFHIHIETERVIDNKDLLIMFQDCTDILSISKKENKNFIKLVWNC